MAMNGDEVLEVLKEIRDEARVTNERLESLEGRVDFLEQRVTSNFNELNRVRVESEMHVATLLVEIRDMIAKKLDDHDMVINHEGRLRSIEDRLADS